MMLLPCPLWYHDDSFFHFGLTCCCTQQPPLHQSQCPFIHMTDSDITLLPNYNNMDLGAAIKRSSARVSPSTSPLLYVHSAWLLLYTAPYILHQLGCLLHLYTALPLVLYIKFIEGTLDFGLRSFLCTWASGRP